MKEARLISSFSAREYQTSIVESCTNQNSLVVLPTGLGKTVIALMLSVYYFNKFKGDKKVLFLAPTKPLVEQQQKSFDEFIENREEFGFVTLTGLIGPEKRKNLYEKSDFIFSTPQLIENDVINGIIDPNDFGFVIVDEAHRATGNYSYCFIAQELAKKGVFVLGLTASPGTTVQEIKTVMANLCVSHVEVKTYEDADVKPYVNKTNIEKVEVSLTEPLIKVKELLERTYAKKLTQLQELGVMQRRSGRQITKTDLLELQRVLRLEVAKGSQADENVWKAISLSAGLMKLSYGQELFESQDILAAYTYFHNFFRSGGDGSKAAEDLTRDVDFRDAYNEITRLKEIGVRHPKLLKLKELVMECLSKQKDLRIIVFNQYRETATSLVAELNSIKEIKASIFVGQAKKGEVAFSQKKQKEVLNEFREGEFNVLVSTSVGEEGLDIPKVDLVIFYEPVASAIRTIQRIGRTGRFDKGKAFVLQTTGTRDIVISFVASAKEKRMYKALKEITSSNSSSFVKPIKEKSLGAFMDSSSDKDSAEKLRDKLDGKMQLYVDNRENNDLVKALYRFEELQVLSKKLEVGDIVISDQIAIERKSKKDFVDSILDKRLFGQLIELAKSYRRPLLIVEGEESIFGIRNVNPNVIRAVLSAIAIDLRMPIIFTDSIDETSKMILTIVKREHKEKKEISLADKKGGHTPSQELEKFVSSIPKVNVVSAKQLLREFKTVKDLANSKSEDIAKTEGVGKVRAESLEEFFRREYLD